MKLAGKGRILHEFQSLKPLGRTLEPEKMKNAFFEWGFLTNETERVPRNNTRLAFTVPLFSTQ